MPVHCGYIVAVLLRRMLHHCNTQRMHVPLRNTLFQLSHSSPHYHVTDTARRRSWTSKIDKLTESSSTQARPKPAGGAATHSLPESLSGTPEIVSSWALGNLAHGNFSQGVLYMAEVLPFWVSLKCEFLPLLLPLQSLLSVLWQCVGVAAASWYLFPQLRLHHFEFCSPPPVRNEWAVKQPSPWCTSGSRMNR